MQNESFLLNIALIEPEIPYNTGNIGRTCVAMNCHLHLVGPLGFEINDHQVKRAGLDYWPHLTMTQYENILEWRLKNPIGPRFFFFSSKAEKSFYDVEYRAGDWLVFGPETRGINPELLGEFPSQTVTIPMLGATRSLNLSNAAAVGVYEAYRQIQRGPPV